MAYLGRPGATAPLTSADIPDNSITGAKIVAGTIEASDVAADMATQAELDLKANIASPTFTGNFTSVGIDDNADATAITITSAEKVGLGTATPITKLHLETTDANSSYNVAQNLLTLRNTSDNNANQVQIAFMSAHATNVAAYIGTKFPNTGAATGELIFGTDGTGSALSEKMRINKDGKVGIGTASPSAMLDIDSSGDNVTAMEIDLSSKEYTSTDPIIVWANHASNTRAVFRIHEEATRSNTATDLFKITSTSSNTYLFNVRQNGNVGIGTSSPATTVHVNGSILCGPNTDYGGTIFPLTVAFTGSSHQGAVFADSATDTGGRYAIYFKRKQPSGNWDTVGSISTTDSATSFNQSSDYRMKENIIPMDNAITRLKELKPSRFNFIKNSDRTMDGFLAHEAQEVVPEAVTGEKDGVTEDILYIEEDDIPEGKKVGDVKTEGGKPLMQGIDQSKLVPLLVGALQEAVARIETLESA